MNTTRQQMLQRIREAVREGNRASGNSEEIPPRGQIGYQGAGNDLMRTFRTAFTAAGGQLHVVADAADAVGVALDLVRARSIRRVLLGRGEVLEALPIVEALRTVGIEIIDALPACSADKEWFAADLGLSGADFLIAQTGSVVLASRPEQPRSLSLLPPIHLVVAEHRQLVPDLFDLFAVLSPGEQDWPACLSIITGPSKTGDIELRLVTGVHGPEEIHVILIAGDASR